MGNIQKHDAIFLISRLETSLFPVGLFVDYDAVISQTRIVIKKIFGEHHDYLVWLEDIKQSYIRGDVQSNFAQGKLDFSVGSTVRGKLQALFQAMKDDLNHSDSLAPDLAEEPDTTKSVRSNKVFVVHGHDEAMKQAVARTLEKLNLDPIILHEKPSAGKTIIEKFSDYADVGFAVILLSPDDLGYSKDHTSKKAMFRARQNVILELGYFLGKLGRARVTALHTPEKNFEIPSDYSGVLFIPFDDSGQWRFELIKELQACGFDVDANKLTR